MGIGPSERTIAAEIEDVSMERPHVVLLGAGASRAALPEGDRNGRKVPLLKEVAVELDLVDRFFPSDLHELAVVDFESAYSRLAAQGNERIRYLEAEISAFFGSLRLPDEANLYDLLQLSLREKDAVFTFNWDPFLIQSRSRLAMLGVPSLPKIFFLHGNVKIGYCRQDENSGLLGRSCSYCQQPFTASSLLFPVEHKSYQNGGLIEREWRAMRYFLSNCFMFTIFGYSAPETDVEAVTLLKEGWGEVEKRQLEQTEIIDITDPEELRQRWKPFIHTHHYDVFDSFSESGMANHPRRTGEAWFAQYLEAQWINNNPVPQVGGELQQLVDWFAPLFKPEVHGQQ